jgi:hypothetical protein
VAGQGQAPAFRPVQVACGNTSAVTLSKMCGSDVTTAHDRLLGGQP